MSEAGPSRPAEPAPATNASSLPKQARPTNPFVYLGIPQAVLDWRPRMPSRNMSIFLAVTFSITGAYVYDRRECKRIRQEYVDQVSWMAEAPMAWTELPRRVRVLGARVPDDGELERSSKWFKRYIKPILVASATDYTLTTATNPGGLGRTLLTEIRAKRLARAAKEKELTQPAFTKNLDGAHENVETVLNERDEINEKLEQSGGIVLLGRGALKEYLWALRKGYSEEIDLREEARLAGLGLSATDRQERTRWDREEEVVRGELEREDAVKGGPFDEPDQLDSDSAPLSKEQTLFPGGVPYRQIQAQVPLRSQQTETEFSGPATLPPESIPEQPPLTLVPFHHAFNWRSWAPKMLHFFNKRSDVRQGGEMALQIINNATRQIDVPSNRLPSGEVQGLLDDQLVEEVRVGGHKDLTFEDGLATGSKDLDFQFELEEHPTPFRKVYRTLPSAHEYHRRTYYTTELPPRIKVARELAAGREPTKAESKNPPPLESELRAERLKKEVKWRRELQGFGVRRSGSGIAWVDGWEDKLTVTLPLTQQDRDRLAEQRQEWRRQKEAYLASIEEHTS